MFCKQFAKSVIVILCINDPYNHLYHRTYARSQTECCGINRFKEQSSKVISQGLLFCLLTSRFWLEPLACWNHLWERLIAPCLHIQRNREGSTERKERKVYVQDFGSKSVDSRDLGDSRVFGTNTFGKVLIAKQVLKDLLPKKKGKYLAVLCGLF